MEISNINIVTSKKVVFGNIFIQNGLIHDIEIISNENKNCKRYILPGMIDPHVHLRDPGFQQKETVVTGTEAALNGGVTTVFDMPNTNPQTTSKSALEEKIALFKNNAKCKWKLFVGATIGNSYFLESINGNDIAGIKIFLGSSTGNMLINQKYIFEKICRIATKKKLIVAVHAEDENLLRKIKQSFTEDIEDPKNHSILRPPKAALKSVKFCIDICRKTKVNMHICHVSTKSELEEIEKAKKEGLDISCEVTPHHLFLSTDDYKKYGIRIKINPPVREIKDTEACFKHLKNGTIDMIATDHAPHTLEEKDQNYVLSQSGIPGLETAIPLLLKLYEKKLLSLSEIVKLYSCNAAKRWGINRGDIEIGKEADLIILDFSQEWKISKESLKTKCGWSPFEGITVKGKLKSIIINGKTIKNIL